jgi:hypothetical protein
LVGLAHATYICIYSRSAACGVGVGGGTHTTKSAPVCSPDSALRQAVCYFHQQTNKASAEPHTRVCCIHQCAQICLMNGERRKALQKHKLAFVDQPTVNSQICFSLTKSLLLFCSAMTCQNVNVPNKNQQCRHKLIQVIFTLI